MTPEYAAGQIDSSSYFSIRRTPKGYRVVIRIRRSSQEMITSMHKTFGGYMGTARGEKPVYYLNFQGTECRDFLLKLIEHLKVKRPHAYLLLDFIELTHQWKMKRTHKMTDEEHAARKVIMDKLAELP